MQWLILERNSEYGPTVYTATGEPEWAPYAELLTFLFQEVRPSWHIIAWGHNLSTYPDEFFSVPQNHMYTWLLPSAIVRLSNESWLRMGPDFARLYHERSVTCPHHDWYPEDTQAFKKRFEKMWGEL